MAGTNESDDADDEFDTECSSEDGSLFSCPFCGSTEDSCPHFFGSQDLNYGGGFSVECGKLDELQALFDQLRDSVDAFLELPKRKPRAAALTPLRPRELVEAVAAGDENEGFAEYVERLGRDSKVRVEAQTHAEDEGGPGMCSVIQMFWAADVPVALQRMRPRIEQDVQRLRKKTDQS